MKFYSTNNRSGFYSLREAVLKGLPEDKGLFMPESFPVFSPSFLMEAPRLSFREIAMEVAETILTDSLSLTDLNRIIMEAISFDAPLVKVTDHMYSLELFHGPTLSFKDFGARFMACLMACLIRNEDRKLTILAATSGDTGSAVASGFFGKEEIEVILLYPSGKVSTLQEKQLTTYGRNITALEINGTFDDCQRLVKLAFSDPVLTQTYRFSTANSINIARLIPQGFYYVYAYSRLVSENRPVVFCVPSGNFGNLTAGLFVREMGLPVHHFIAATNVNDVVPSFLNNGMFQPRTSVQTLSNAMDVGNPSNFSRMTDLFNGSAESMKKCISGYTVDDLRTMEIMGTVKKKYGYLLDPHGAVSFVALQAYLAHHHGVSGVFLETAHPAKFKETVEMATGEKVNLPPALLGLENRKGHSIKLESSFENFRDYLLSRDVD